MNYYSSYSDSPVEWMGKIPSHWILTKNRFGFKKYKNGKNDSNDTSVLSLTTKGVKIKEDLSFGKSTESYIGHQIVEKGDIVFTPRDFDQTPILSDVSKYDGCISNLYIVDKTNERLLNHYINYYWYGLKYSVDYFKNFSNGIRFSFNRFQFDEIPLLIPPLSEQTQIVSFLDNKTQKIDELIKKTEKKIQLLKEKRLKLIEDIILNQKTERVRLEYVLDLIKRPINRDDNKTYNKIGMYNWGRGIFKYPSELGSELGDSTFNFIREGDLLLSGQFSWEGSVSMVEKEMNNCISSHRFHILRGKENILLNEYLWSFFTSQEGHFLLTENSFGSSGRNQPLNIRRLLKEKVPIPHLRIQEEIKDFFNQTRKFEKYSQKRIKFLKEYRKSLISEVVIGKVDVRGLN
jgi:type I restriction enzyme, S subunit